MFSKSNQNFVENSHKTLTNKARVNKCVHPFSTKSSSLIPKSEEARLKQYSKSGRSSVTKQYVSSSRDDKNDLNSLPFEQTATVYFSKGMCACTVGRSIIAFRDETRTVKQVRKPYELEVISSSKSTHNVNID